MKNILTLDDFDTLKSIVFQELTEMGIDVESGSSHSMYGKSRKPSGGSKEKEKSTIFGQTLDHLPSVFLEERGIFVPRFLYEACQYVVNHLDVEGLFRKAGSLARQKEMRLLVEKGNLVFATLGHKSNDPKCESANVLDTCSLIKCFFREMPEPLLTLELFPAFIQAEMAFHNDEPRRLDALLLLCSILPPSNLNVLKYFTEFLKKVSLRAKENKMSASNLALLLAPNVAPRRLLHGSKSEKAVLSSLTENQVLTALSSLLECLIIHSEKIGFIPDSVYQKCVTVSYMSDGTSATDFDDETLDSTSEKPKKKKKKRRSSSIQRMMQSLSQSFSRWRRRSGSLNRSGVSCGSVDDSSLEMSTKRNFDQLTTPVAPFQPERLDTLGPAVTPKVALKRSGTDAGAFSAAKKKKILENLPNKSALNTTAFTPAAVRQPSDLISIGSDSVDGAESILTENCESDISSFMKSPKSKRKSRACSSNTPTVPKKKRKRSFFKRLSGGKSSDHDPDDSIGSRLAVSAPMPLTSSINECSTDRLGLSKTFDDEQDTSISPVFARTESNSLVITNSDAVQADTEMSREELAELAARVARGPPPKPCTPKPAKPNHRRGFSDTSQSSAKCNLKRGSPNTISSGLPSRKKGDGDSDEEDDDDTMEMSNQHCGMVPRAVNESELGRLSSPSPSEKTQDSGVGSSETLDANAIDSSAHRANLIVSEETQKMLQKSGLRLSTSLSAEECKRIVNKEISFIGNPGHVASSIEKFEMQSTEVTVPGPHSFKRSPIRTRGSSPIRVPSIFTKNKEEAEKLREAIREHSKFTAKLPIGTGLIKPASLSELSELENQSFAEGLPGVTPKTPIIRQQLLPTTQLLANMAPQARPVTQRRKSPVKPPKRLQPTSASSSKSPKKHSSSPMKPLQSINVVAELNEDL